MPTARVFYATASFTAPEWGGIPAAASNRGMHVLRTRDRTDERERLIRRVEAALRSEG